MAAEDIGKQIAASSNPFENPWFEATPSTAAATNPFAMMAADEKKSVELDKRKELLKRDLESKNSPAEVMPWFGTKSEEMWNEEREMKKLEADIKQVMEQCRISSQEVKIVVALGSKIIDEFEGEVETFENKHAEDGKVKAKHLQKLIHLESRLNEKEKDLLNKAETAEKKERSLKVKCAQFENNFRARHRQMAAERMDSAEMDYLLDCYKKIHHNAQLKHLEALEVIAPAIKAREEVLTLHKRITHLIPENMIGDGQDRETVVSSVQEELSVT